MSNVLHNLKQNMIYHERLNYEGKSAFELWSNIIREIESLDGTKTKHLNT